jgi:hypothetical protein
LRCVLPIDTVPLCRSHAALAFARASIRRKQGEKGTFSANARQSGICRKSIRWPKRPPFLVATNARTSDCEKSLQNSLRQIVDTARTLDYFVTCEREAAATALAGSQHDSPEHWARQRRRLIRRPMANWGKKQRHKQSKLAGSSGLDDCAEFFKKFACGRCNVNYNESVN